MATEIDIPESVLLKEVKIEENAFSSESLEEKVRELVDSKVKQLETSNLVTEPVNTKLETGTMTNESETFFQTFSVPMVVTADEHSNIPETSKDTPKQEDQEEKVTKIEALTDEKPVDDVVEAVSTQTERKDKNDGKAIQIDEETQEKEQAHNTLEKDHAADSNEQDLNEMPRESVKEKTENISNDAQEASELCQNGPNKEREIKPEESVKNALLSTADIKQEEKTEELPGVGIEEEVKQNGLLHEEKGEEATQSDDGQKEKSENPIIMEVREENSLEKIEYESSTPIATVNKDEAEEKEQVMNVIEKDQGEDGVTSIQDMMPEGGIEETKHQGDCNEAEVIAKEITEKETEEIIYSVGTPENIEPLSLNDIIPTDVSITAHTQPEEPIQNEEQNDVEAIDIKDGETKDYGSSMVKEIYEEPVSDKANTEEGPRHSESSNKETIENDVVSKDEGQEKNDVECSQDEPSTGDLEAKTKESITNDEKAAEKGASDETGPVNAESEVGLKVSGSMEPTEVEVLSTIEKSQDDTDGAISLQDATCEDKKETESGENETTVADTEELNETPTEFEEEAKKKSIDSEASYYSENKAEEKLVERPDESLNGIEQKEETEDIRQSAVLEEKLVQVETREHEETEEAEATHSDDGQKEKFDNPAVTKICEEKTSEKVESESSSMMLNEQVTSILTKDEEKEQEVTVVEKDQGVDTVTSGEEASFEGCLEEMNHHSEGIKTEVVNAKGSVEEDTEEIKSTAETLEEKEQIVNLADVSITTQTKPEDESIENAEKNDEEAMKSDYGEMKDSESLIVSEICEDTISHKSKEGLKISEVASKAETEAPEQDQKEDAVTLSQAATSIEDLQVEKKESIINEENTGEEATEKEECEDMGPENVESDVGLELSDNMEPSVKEAFSTEEKDEGDTDCVTRSQDATCVDVIESMPTILGDFKAPSETPREFIKEETEDKPIDAQETNENYENKAEDKLLECPDESVKEIKKEEEIEEIRPSVEVEEKLERNELLHGVTTDASISTQTELSQDEITEPDNKDEQETNQSDDGQKEQYENSSINKACEEISSGNVESESSVVKLYEIETLIENKDENEEKEQEVIVLEKDQGEDGVKSAQNVPSEECLEEANHDSEFIEPVVVEAKGSIEDATEEIRSSVKTPEDGTPETEVKNDGEAIKSDDGQVGITVNEICEESVSHNTESEEGLTVSHTSSKENEHELVRKDETEEKEQDQEEDDVTVSQTETSIEYLQVENSKSTIKEEDNVKEACEDLGADIIESGVGLKTSDSIEISEKETPSTVQKGQDDTDGVPSSQDAATEDIKETTSTIVSDSKELNETPREIIKEETEDKTIDAQEANKDCENKAEEKLVEQPDESVKETEQEEETEEIRPSVEIKEKLEQNELLHGVTTDAIISTQTKSQDEITEPEDKGEEEATQSDDGQKEKNDNSTINEVCKEISSEKVESEGSSVKLNEIETSVVSKDEDEEKEQEVIMLEKDQEESEGCLEEVNHDREFIEPEVADAKGSIEDATEEIKSSVKTPEDETPETEGKNDGEAIKSDDCQVGITEACEETFSHNTESEEGPTVFDTSSKETNEHKVASKDETEEKNQDQEEDDLTVSQSETSLEDLKVENNDTTVNEEANEKEACEDMGTDNIESGVSLKTSDNIEPSVKDALSTVEKEHGDADGVPSSQDATCEDTETTSAIISYSKELNETTREFIKEETEDKISDVQEANDDFEDKAEEKLVEQPDESFKEVEQEEKTEENKPSVQTEEKLEQNELSHDAATDASILTQTNSQVEVTEPEEKDEGEAATQSDDGQKEKYDISSINEVCPEISSEKVESEISIINVNEKETSFLSNDGDDEKEQEVTVLEKDQGEEGITSAQDVPFEACLEETNHANEGIESEVANVKGSVVEDTEEIRSSVETPEEGATENKEKDDEEAIKSEERQIKDSGIPMVKEICEEAISHNIESGVSRKISDNIEPSVKEALSTVEKEQGDPDGVPISQDETMSTIVSDSKELNETTREFIKEETEDKTSDIQEANDDCEDKAQEKLVEQPDESFKVVEQEEETEKNRPSVQIEEKLEQNELSHGVTTDASISTQKSEVEITEPEEKDVPQEEEGVTSAKDVPSEACLEETNHDNEDIESEAKNAQGSEEDDIKEIRSSVETLEEGATENKQKDDEEAMKSEASQTKEPGIPIVEEICGVTVSQNTESEEGLKVSDISSKETNEHELASKDEAEQKEQDQEKDDITCSQDAAFDLQENKNESTKKDDNNDEVTIEKESSEETNAENTESEVGPKQSDDMEPSKNEALDTIEKEQGNTDGVTSSQDASIVSDFKELNEEERPREFYEEETEDKLTDAQETTEKCENGAQDIIVQIPEENVKTIELEEEKTEATDPLVEIEEQNELVCDVTSNDSSISTQTIPQGETLEHEEKNEEVATQSDDSQNDKSDKLSIKEVCEDEKPKTVEYETSTPIAVINKDEDQEHDQAVNMLEKDEGEGEDDVTSEQNATPTDVCISTHTVLESTENEEKHAEEVVERDDSQTKKLGSPMDKEICERIVSEKETKYEDRELDISEKSQSGGEDVKSSQIAANEDMKETTIAQYVATVAYSEEPPALSAIPKEIPKEETQDTLIDVQKARGYEDREMPEKIVNDISSKIEQDEYIEEIKPSVETNEEKDVCISTPTEAHEEATQIEENDLHNTEAEEVTDLSNSSDVNQNEKDISLLSKDEVQENEQELNISEQDQGKDEVTCSQDPAAVSEEELQGKYEDEDAEQKLVETREIPKEYNEVIQSSGEKEEKMEQKIEPKQEITEKEVFEEAIEVVCEEARSEKVEPVEALELSDGSEIKINEKTINFFKDEDREETTEAEEKKDSEVIEKNDAISSHNESIDETQESTGESATTIDYIEETQDVSASAKEILEKETEDKLVDAQQANKQNENGAKDEKEQQPEESVNKAVDYCSEVVEETIKEDESDSRNKEEVFFEKENNEAGEADAIECETTGGTQELSPENKDGATGDVSKSTEGVSLEGEMSYDKAGSPLGDEMEDEIKIKKEDQHTETEKISSELEHSKEQNVEEIPACPTETTEKSENGEQDIIEQIPEESVKKTELEEEKTEATDPLAEIEEQNELLCDVTSNDSSISTQAIPQAETLEHEEKNEEVATQSDEKQETVEYETSTPITVVNKDEDQELGQAFNMLDKGEGEDDVASAQNATPIDVCISTQTVLEKESTENEEKHAEEVAENDDSQTKKLGSPMDKEICEKIVSEKETKDEDQELDISEKSQSGGEDVKSSQIAANEDIKETTIQQYVATVAYSEEPPALSAISKEIPKEKTEDTLIVQKAREYQDREMPENIVNDISSKIEQEEYIEEIKPSVETNEEKDVCISTPTKAHEESTKTGEKDLLDAVTEEVIDLSKSSDLNQNEKDISLLSKDEVQENEQELNISEQDQGKHEVTRSQDPAAVSEEELQGKYEDEDGEQKLVETREIPKEYNEVIQTSGEKEEKLEQQIESKQEITEKEVCEETVEVVSEEARSEKVESVEALELSDSSEIKITEKTITSSKDEDQEETTETEEKKDCEVIENNDAISSHDESKDETQERTGESAITIDYTEEAQDVSTSAKEILEKEAEDRLVDAQQANKQNENGAKDEKEQQPEESVNKAVDYCSEVVEETIKEEESDSRNKEEVFFEKQNNEAGEADAIECETTGGTQELSPENKDGATGDVSKSTEGVSQDSDMSYDKAGPLGDETEDEILIKKEDQHTETEKISSELEHSKEQNVGEIPACPTETISEKTEDKITANSEDLSPDSIKENESTTKEEQCVVDGRTREIEISTLEHEPIEEQIGGIDEVLKEKSTNLKETTEVEPQEVITPSSSIETSTVDTSNSDKKKAENEDSPTEDVDSVSELETPEVVTESKDSNLKEECVNTTTTSYVEEEKEIVTEEISSDEKAEQPVEIKKESVEDEEVCEEKTESEEGVEDDKSSVETKEKTEQQGLLHVITTAVCSSADTKPNEDTVKDEEKNDELGQPEVNIVEEILEKKEDGTTKEKEDLSHDSTNDIEPQEDITPSSSAEFLTTNASNTEKVNSECENLPTEELESELEVQVPEVEPKTEESNLKEECIISATETHVDAEQVTVSKEISSDQILDPYGEKKLTHESTTADHIEETILQQEESDIASEKNQGDLDNEATQANQLNSAEDCSERVKDVVLTKESSYSDLATDGNHEVTKVIVEDGQIGQEDVPAAEDISCESTLEDDNVDKAPKEEKITSIEGAARIEPQVDSSNIESTACQSESETTPTQSLESVSVVIEGSEDSKVKEGATKDTVIPNLDLEKEEKDHELISEVQTPEAFPTMGIKGEHPEGTNENCETLTGGEISEKLLDAVKEIDTKEDIEVIAEAEEKAIEESNQDTVAEVMVDEYLQQTEEVLLEVEKSKESKIIEDKIDEQASCIQDLTEDTLDPKRTVEKPTEAAEIVTENTEASPEILLAKHDSDIATNTEKIEHEIKEKDATFQDPNLSSESSEGKQNSIGDMLNKATEVVQPQPQDRISSTKSDVEIKEEVELTHSGEQQTSVEKNPEDSPVLLSEVKEQCEEAPVKDAQKDFDHTTKVTVVDVVNAECLNVEPQHLNTEEATLPSVNHENQTEQKKADKNIDAAIHIKDVKSSDVELQSDMDAPVMDAKDNKTILGTTGDKRKTTEEVSGIKQEPLALDTPVNTVATKSLDISHKGVTKEGGEMSDVKGKSESAAPTKEEIADSGVKTDEENEEQDDNEDNENSGLCSETPVMVEASKDIEVKVHKKSHNILSGVGSKVKHSIAKVKKAITGGKSSSPKPPSPKERTSDH